MKKIIVLIALIGLVYYFKPGLFTLTANKGAFDEQGNPVTLVFTHDRCGQPCDDAITLLDKRRVQYTLHKLDGNAETQDLWKGYDGLNSFPMIIAGNEREYGSFKSRIISKLALTYGKSVLTKSERYYMAKHFYDNGEPKLIMYGASWCGYCKKMRETLIVMALTLLKLM